MVQRVAHTLLAGKEVVYGYLGVLVQPLEERLAKLMKTQHGVIIHEVLAKSPAAKAGLKAGDIIVAVNDHPVDDPVDLQDTVGSLGPQRKISVRVIHYHSRLKQVVSVQLEKLPKNAKLPEEPAHSQGADASDLRSPHAFGLRITQDPKSHAFVVVGVAPGSLAQRMGIMPDDILLAINGKEVHSLNDIGNTLKKPPLSIEVKRGNRHLFFQQME